MSAPDLAGASPPRHRLFSPSNVGVASFVGSILAGSILLALNFRRLGRGRAALLVAALGVTATGLLVTLAFVTADGDGLNRIFSIVNVLLALGMKQLAEVVQGDALHAHRIAGGRVGAGWATAGIAFGCLGVAVAAVVSIVLLTEPELGERVSSGSNTVYYKDGVSEAEARAVLAVLRDEGLFVDDGEADVQVRRRAGAVHLVIVVGAEGLDEDLEDEFRALGAAVSERVFDGAPVAVELSDKHLEVQKRLPVE